MPAIRKFLFFIFTITAFPYGSAQTDNSIGLIIKKIESAKSDTTKIELYGDIVFGYLQFNIDSAEFYAGKAMELAKKSRYKKYYADALSVYGTVHRYKGNVNEALENYFKCYEIRKEIKDSTGMYKILGNIGNAYNHLLNEYELSLKYYEQSLQIQKNLGREDVMSVTYLNISSVYMTQGKFLPALDYMQQAEKIAEKYNDRGTLAKIYLNMGDMLNTIGQNAKGKKYLEQSLEIRKELKDTLGIANTLNTLSAVYESEKNYETAYKYCLDALRLREKISDSLGLSVSCGNMAIMLLRLNKPEEALQYGLRNLAICEQLNYDQAISFACTILGEIRMALNDPAGSVKFCKRSYEIISKFESVEETRDACNCLYLAYDKLNDSKNALKFYKEYNRLNDTLKSQNKAVEVVQEQMKNEYGKKILADSIQRTAEENIKELDRIEKARISEEQIRFQRVMMISGTMIFALILVSSVLFFRINKSRQKARAQQKLVETELMALRAQMNPHFIFNCLSSIQNCIDKNEFSLADKYLGKFSKLLRIVLKTSRKPFITIEDEVNYLSLYIELENLRQNNSFTYSVHVAEDIDSTETEIPVMLIQPYVENAIKHGLAMKKENGLLEINFRKNEKELIISVKDNGIGRERSQQFKKNDLKRKDHESLGLLITQERVNLLYNTNDFKNTITINDLHDENGNANGTEVILIIPIERTMG